MQANANRAQPRGAVLIPLSFHPDFAVGEVLLLPDGDQPLQAVDAFERGGERRLAMRRGDDDRDAGLADLAGGPADATMAMRPIANAAAMSAPISAIILMAIAS